MNRIHTLVFLVSSLFAFYHVEASCPSIVSRQSWGASSPKSRQNLRRNPPPFVVVHHSETPACLTPAKCQQRIRNIQNDHMNNRGWNDIGYNFLIGGDGNIYEGRGWGVHGSHVPGYNSKSIGICLIGNFNTTPPPAAQLDALKNLISCAKDTGRVTSDYHVIGHRQGKATECPGNALYEEVKRLPHWDPHPN